MTYPKAPTVSGDPLENISVSTGSLWPKTTEDSLKILSELSISQIELVLQRHDFFMTYSGNFKITWQSVLIPAIEDGRFHVRSVHAPLMDAEHGHSNKARLLYLERCIALCAELNSPVLVVHPFHLLENYERTLEYLSGKIDDVNKILLPGVRDALDFAHQLLVDVALENVKLWASDTTGYFNSPSNILRFFNDIDSPALMFTLDIVHAQLNNSLWKFLTILTPYIVNVHMAGLTALGQRGMLGQGELQWSQLWLHLLHLPAIKTLTLELTQATLYEIQESFYFWAELVKKEKNSQKI